MPRAQSVQSNPSPMVALRAAGALAVIKLVRAVVPSPTARPTERPQPDRRGAGDVKRRPGRLGVKNDTPPDAAAAEPGRGREAESPTQIPARGWKDILWRV